MIWRSLVWIKFAPGLTDIISKSSIDPIEKLSKKGVTFIEVMMSLVVLTIGIVMIFRSFFVAFDRMSFLKERLYASIALDNEIEKIERNLRVNRALPSESQKVEIVDVGPKKVRFNYSIDIQPVDGIFGCQ